MPLLLYSNGNYEKKEGFGYEFQSEKNNYDSIIRCVSLCCYNVHPYSDTGNRQAYHIQDQG